MVIRINRYSVKANFMLIQRLLLITGVLALAYCAVVLADSYFFQAFESWQFRSIIANRLSRDIHPSLVPVLPQTIPEKNLQQVDLSKIYGNRSPMGELEIPSVGIRVMIFEGTDNQTLSRAVGHVSGTALPGPQGNVAIAGHRDTFFRGLRNLHKDDQIALTTLNGVYRYRVDFTQVVNPEDTYVLDESDDATLTLISCYPFNFVGSAPRRFIVRALRISK